MKKTDSFFEKVYAVTKQIPYGRVTSYGAIANYLGSARSSRMVGWALNNTKTINIPAHRVVNKNGILTGKHHFEGSTLMQQLLESEGVTIKNNQITPFEKYFWDPLKEL